MNTPDDLTNADWFKSSYSSGQGECVEVAFAPGRVAARDSKNRNGRALVFTPDGWRDFIRAVDGDDLRP